MTSATLNELQQLVYHGQNETIIQKVNNLLKRTPRSSSLAVKLLTFKTVALMRLGRFKDAELVGQDAISTARSLQQTSLIVDASLALAESLWQQGRLSEALTIVKDCERLLLETKSVLGESENKLLSGKIHFHQAVIHQKKGSARMALSHFQKARERLEQAGDPHHLARCINGMGLVFWNTGKMEQARECFESARDYAKQVEDLYSMAYSHNNMAIYYRYKGDLDAALDQLEKSKELWEKMGNQHGVATALINMGEIYREKRNFQKAKELYEQSLALFEQVGDEINSLVVLEALAENHRKTGNLTEYREVLESAIRIAEKRDLKNNLSSSYVSMARIYLDMGDLAKVEQYLNRFEALLNEIGDNIDVLEYLRLRAAVAWARNDQNLAMDYLKKRLQLSRELKNPQEIVKSLYEMIVGYLSMHDHENADNLLDEMRAFAHEHSEDNFIRVAFSLSRALHLNSLPRFIDRVKALAYIDEVMEEEGEFLTELKVTAILLKIKILLDYAMLTNDEAIMLDIRSLVEELSRHAKRQFLHPLLIESYMLKARLEVIQLDFDKARNLLSFAEHVAMERGLIALAMKISIEHDKILEYIEILKKKDDEALPSLRERVLHSGIADQICLVQYFCLPIIRELPSEEPLFFAIFSEHGHPIYTRDFSSSPKFQELLVGSFLAALATFAKQVFNQPLERAKLGEYNLLIRSFNSFRFFYMFRGLTYPAQQKIEEIIEKIRNDERLMQRLGDSHRFGRKIDHHSEDLLNLLVHEIIFGVQ